jgi:ssDNA-binding Zn-finger/Zn-ribbon topoisomerase 1
MESMLDDIAGGRSNYKAVVAALHGQLEAELPALRALRPRAPADEPPCPKCGKSTLRTIKGPSGLFRGCRAYPECRHTEPLPDAPGKSGKSTTSKPSAKKPAAAAAAARPKAVPAPNAAGPTLKACPACGKPMILRKGPTSQFWGCSGFPACRNTAKA